MPCRGLFRAAFWGYAVILFAATHKPALTIPMEGRKDLIIHAVAFGLWTALFLSARFFGPVLSGKNVLAALLIAPLYAAIDEGLQDIPWLRRHAAWDDFFFNLAGIAFVLAPVSFLVLLRRTTALRGPTISVPAEPGKETAAP